MITSELATRHAELVLACKAQRPGRPFEILIVTCPSDLEDVPKMKVVWKRKSRKKAAKPDPNQVDMFN